MKPGAWIDRDRLRAARARGGPFPFSVSMVSWAYNEEPNIAEFLTRAQRLMDSLGTEYEHILVDDASTDRTYPIACEIQSRYPQLRIIRNPRNADCGWNIRTCVREASKEVMFWQTADWSYDIARIERYLWCLETHDVVQGVRIRSERPTYQNLFRQIPGLRDLRVSRRSDNLFKAIVSITNYYLIRLLFRIPLLDFQNVTIYPTRLAKSIAFESHSAFTNPEMLIKSYWKGAAIAQVPIAFIRRTKGTAKGTRYRAIAAAIRHILGCWFRWVVLGRRPDKGRGSVSPVDPLFLDTPEKRIAA